MASKRKKENSLGKTLFFLLVGLSTLGLFIWHFLKGQNIALFHSKGAIATEQRDLMLYATALIMTVAVPTVIILYLVAWKYRESNTKKSHQPSAKQGKFLVFTMWMIPVVLVIVLSTTLLPKTRELEPHRSLKSGDQTLKIEVIAMRWKWLFIYPEQQVASVNFVQIPQDRPVEFKLTGDEAPMSSFWVPNLSGQLYAMTGHVNRLNLIADEQGDYPGRSAELTGHGFEGMKFMTRVTSKDDFDSWVQRTRNSSDSLDAKSYKELLKPSMNHVITLFALNDDSLFSQATMKYSGSHNHGSMNDKEKEHTTENKNEKHEESSNGGHH